MEEPLFQGGGSQQIAFNSDARPHTFEVVLMF
jgi:hypothetical protein